MNASVGHAGDRLPRLFGHRVRQVLQSLWASGSLQVFLFGSGIIVSRGLGPGGRGNLALVLVLPAVASQIVAVGVPSASTYFIARNRAAWRGIARQLAGITAVQVVRAAALLVVLDLVFISGRGTEPRIAALFTLACIPFIITEYYGLAFLQGLGELRLFNIFRIAPAAAYTAGLVGFLVFGLTLVACTAIWVAAQVLTTVALGTALVRYSRRAPTIVGPMGTPGRGEVVRFGVKGFLAQMSPVETLKIDQLLVAALFSPQVLGYYAVANSVSNAPRFIADGIVAVGYPHVAEQDPRAALHSAKRYLLVAVVLCGGAAGAVAIALPWLIPVLFGQRFGPATSIGLILVLGAALISIRRVASDCLRALGQPGRATAIEVTTWLVLAAGVVSVGRLGHGRGIALSLAISAAVGLALVSTRLLKRGRHEGAARAR